MAALVGISIKPKDGGSAGYSCKVPLDLLAEDGVPPAQGDSVSYQVDGTVSSVSDTTATISIEAINGQPVSDAAASEPAGPPAGSSAAMRPGLAAKAAGQPLPF